MFLAPEKKETVKERAQREREERAAKREREQLAANQQEAARRLQGWHRQTAEARVGHDRLIKEWDEWAGYTPALEAGGGAAINTFRLAPPTSFEIIRLMGVCMLLRDPTGSSRFDTACSGKTGDDFYLSGVELQFLVKAWNCRRWAKDTSATPAALVARQTVVDGGAMAVVGQALFRRSVLVASIRGRKARDAADEKRLRGLALWMNAALHVSVLACEMGDEGSERNLATLIIHILSIPMLCPAIDAQGLDLLYKGNILWRSLTLMAGTGVARDAVFKGCEGELSLFLLANLIDLYRLCELKKDPNTGEIRRLLIKVIAEVLDECGSYVSSKASNLSRFHPVLQWYSGPRLDVPNEYHTMLPNTLGFLWSRDFIKTAFEDLLAYDFPIISKRPSKKPNVFGGGRGAGNVNEKAITNLSLSTLSSCKLFLSLSRIVLTFKPKIMNALSWTPGLIPNLWRLIVNVGPKGSSGDGTRIFLSSAKNPDKELLMPILQIFCEASCTLFLTLDNEDIYVKENPFILDELAELCLFLNSFCFNIHWSQPEPKPGVPLVIPAILDPAQKLLGILYETSTRRPFGGEEDGWIMKELKKSSFIEEVKTGTARSVTIVQKMPQCIPFSSRVEIFRSFIVQDKMTLGTVPITVQISRLTVLEDGFRFLGRLNPSQIKQTIRVKYINEFGLAEAGIDQSGVFKEFLEDMCKRAFNTDFGLFRVTDDGNCVPSVQSNIHEDHLALFDFVGRIFGKALYEGIVIDIPFATFIYAKLLGRFNYLEDLPSLDPQLYQNLIFFKHYKGDAEDLGLTFTVDSNQFGSITSKEIKPGGSAVAVTNENKYEYIHLISDYRLNQECKEQFRAFVTGFRSIVPERYLNFFSPVELQKMMSGENTGDFDVSDLRQYSKYEGGYFDQHSTIRMFWQVLSEVSPKERRQFLKFVTSCSNPPVGGFQYLDPPFTIRYVAATKADDAEVISPFKALGTMFGIGKENIRLPTAATCFNLLKLPGYQKKSSLKAKLTMAIGSGAGFELS
ncbi:Ubiquitin-protein ligase E3B [Irineochytrium annulatum]|nr:Ubiquitin-protein ligase E3B [Irineochytrium annulatum]